MASKSRLVSVVLNMVQGLLGSNASHILSPLSSMLQVVWNLVPVFTKSQDYCDV